MAAPTYRISSWVSDKLILGPSSIHGTGVFAGAPISKGEAVIIWGGEVLSLGEAKGGKAQPHTYVAISEDMGLGTPVGAPITVDDYMNHSCNPNIWMADEVTLVASRHIAVGEELTADYAIYRERCGATA